MGEALLSITALNKHFDAAGGKVQALEDVELEVQEGEFITVIGPSGCGKAPCSASLPVWIPAIPAELPWREQRSAGRESIRGLFFRSTACFPGLR